MHIVCVPAVWDGWRYLNLVLAMTCRALPVACCVPAVWNAWRYLNLYLAMTCRALPVACLLPWPAAVGTLCFHTVTMGVQRINMNLKTVATDHDKKTRDALQNTRKR